MNILVTILIIMYGNLQTEDYSGTYSNAFGEQFLLLPDKTFRYYWRFDLAGSWSRGQWTIDNDTLRLKIIPVYDTLALNNEAGKFIKDTLVLSGNETTERITLRDRIPELISSGGQNRKMPNTVFYIKRNKLIVVHKGKLLTKKIKGFWSDKKYRTWFIKEKKHLP